MICCVGHFNVHLVRQIKVAFESFELVEIPSSNGIGQLRVACGKLLNSKAPSVACSAADQVRLAESIVSLRLAHRRRARMVSTWPSLEYNGLVQPKEKRGMFYWKLKLRTRQRFCFTICDTGPSRYRSARAAQEAFSTQYTGIYLVKFQTAGCVQTSFTSDLEMSLHCRATK